MHKSQAAMEFMLSYGWAAVALAVVIGALIYVGVLDPGEHFGKRCHLPQGLSCRDMEVLDDVVQLSIKNNRGDAISGIEVFIPGCTAWLYPGMIMNREKFTANIIECDLTEGSLSAVVPVIQYTFVETGIQFSDKGSMYGSFESSGGQSVVSDLASCTPFDLTACKVQACRQSFCFEGMCTYRITC